MVMLYKCFKIAVARSTCQWKSKNYPHLCSPQSPCLTLQWTYRDGEVVNLPWALLVAGDIIVMKPGQQAPGYCVPYDVRDLNSFHRISRRCSVFKISKLNRDFAKTIRLFRIRLLVANRTSTQISRCSLFRHQSCTEILLI